MLVVQTNTLLLNPHAGSINWNF